jgi:tetratricopeptide (TPR) repeat protein
MRPKVIAALATALLLTAPLHAQRIKLPKSLKELEAAVVKDSNDGAAHYNVALAYWNEKRWDDAERELRLALCYLPYARRPKLWDDAQLDNPSEEVTAILKESDRMYARAFMVDPLVEVKIIAASLPKSDARWELYAADFYDWYYKGFEDFNLGNYEAAYGRFTHLVADLDNTPEFRGRIPANILWYQGLAAAHAGKYDVAIGNFQRLVDRLEEEKEKHKGEFIRVPLSSNEYRYFIAYFKQMSGQRTAAQDLYREVLENDIGVYMAHVQLANMSENAREYADAIKERERAVDANPDDPSLLVDLGVTRGKAGKFPEAEEALRRAREANPRDPKIPFWLGVCLQAENKTAEARVAYTEFLGIAPSRYEAQIQMARQRLAQLQ